MKSVWLLVSGLGLMSCDKLGIPTPEREHAIKEAEGKAVGAACRHAGRAIEDCYTMNPKALKSAVFDGWKEMNGYMAENKIEVQKPLLTDKADEFKPGRKHQQSKGLDGFPPIEPLIAPKVSAEGAETDEAGLAGKTTPRSGEAPEQKAGDKSAKTDKAHDKAQHRAERRDVPAKTEKTDKQVKAEKADKTDKADPANH
jgi:hypothetical protein